MRLRHSIARAIGLLALTALPVHAGPTVTLRWTATGDDGLLGTASRYEVLVAPFPLTPLNLAFATRVIPTPTSTPAGMPMSRRFELPTAGLWYFAVRAVDEAGNWSGLSNVASMTVVTDIQTRIGFSLGLSAPFPQPAKTDVRLTAVLPTESDVEVIAYDIRGARVRTVHRGRMNPGEHEIRWDLDDDQSRPLAPGVYLVRARLGGQAFTRRVVVTR